MKTIDEICDNMVDGSKTIISSVNSIGDGADPHLKRFAAELEKAITEYEEAKDETA